MRNNRRNTPKDIEVRFLEDGITFECSLDRVHKKVKENTYSVKWRDGRSYEAEILRGLNFVASKFNGKPEASIATVAVDGSSGTSSGRNEKKKKKFPPKSPETISVGGPSGTSSGRNEEKKKKKKKKFPPKSPETIAVGGSSDTSSGRNAKKNEFPPNSPETIVVEGSSGTSSGRNEKKKKKFSPKSPETISFEGSSGTSSGKNEKKKKFPPKSPETIVVEGSSGTSSGRNEKKKKKFPPKSPETISVEGSSGTSSGRNEKKNEFPPKSQETIAVEGSSGTSSGRNEKKNEFPPKSQETIAVEGSSGTSSGRNAKKNEFPPKPRRETASEPDILEYTDDDSCSSDGGISEYDDSDYLPSDEELIHPQQQFKAALSNFRRTKYYEEDGDELQGIEGDQDNEDMDEEDQDKEDTYEEDQDKEDTDEEEQDKTDEDEKDQDEVPTSPTVEVKAGNKKLWNKRRWCKFCLKSVQKLPRHLEKRHEEEKEVAKLLSYPKGSKDRRALLDKLRREGGFVHNRQVILSQKGELYMKRRPKCVKKADEYLPCPLCKEMFLKHYLHRHRASAHKNEYVKGTRVQGSAFLMLPKKTSVSPLFERDVLATMEPDEVGRIAQTDDLILERGQKLYEALGSRKDHKHYIATKMRELARFLRAMREVTNNDTKSLASCLRGPQVNNVIKAVKKVAKYDETSMRFGVPSLALKIGHGLNETVTILKGKSAEEDDTAVLASLDNFDVALRAKWASWVSSSALRTLRRRKWNKESTIPLAEDVKRLNRYLQEKIRLNLKKIAEIADPDYLLELSKLTLCLLVAFNRRRSGEVAKMLLQDVIAARTGDVRPEVLEKLSPLQQQLAETLTRFEIRGKRDRAVPILLTPLMKEATDILKTDISRQLMNVHPENKFFFASSSSIESHLSASSCFKRYSVLCGAEKPNFLRSTNLRKHFATFCTLENLQKNQLDVVAGFMGHDIRVHREFYRLPQSTLQVVQMGQLITQKESGIEMENINSIDDVKVDEFIQIEMDVDSDEEEAGDRIEEPVVAEPARARRIAPPTRRPTTRTAVNNIIKKRAWTDEENAAIQKNFGGCIRARMLPGKERIEEVMKSSPVLSNRTWRNIKDKIRNSFHKEK